MSRPWASRRPASPETTLWVLSSSDSSDSDDFESTDHKTSDKSDSAVASTASSSSTSTTTTTTNNHQKQPKQERSKRGTNQDIWSSWRFYQTSAEAEKEMERMATAEFGWHPSCGKGTGDVWWRKCHLHPTTEGKLQTYHCPFGGVKNEQVGICSRQFQLNMLSSEGIFCAFVVIPESSR